jgi:hypothetical protein
VDTLFGIKVRQSPLVQPVPVLTFDPLRKCTWATPEYRASVDAWLLKRFGTQEVAYMLDPRALGLPGDPTFVLNPKQVAMLKMRNMEFTGNVTR